MARLTDREVAQVHDMHTAGISLTAIASQFEVSKGCVWKIVHGRRRGGGATVQIPTSRPHRLVKAEIDYPVEPPLLTATETQVLCDLADAGWAYEQLSSHFDLTISQVRRLLRFHGQDGDLPVRRVCHDPLPELPALDGELEPGARAIGLVAWALSSSR